MAYLEKVSHAARKVAERIRDIVAVHAAAHGTRHRDGGPMQIGLRQRRVYIAREVYEAYFAGCSSVILLRKEQAICWCCLSDTPRRADMC